MIRSVDPKSHATLTNGAVRELDFKFSSDMEYVEASRDAGLSFATAGQALGTTQDITTKYPAKNGHGAITNHVHTKANYRNISLIPENFVPTW